MTNCIVRAIGPLGPTRTARTSYSPVGTSRSSITLVRCAFHGPFLQFTINGHAIGDELHVKRGTQLTIAADAQMNPDVDGLDRLELVVLGDPTDAVHREAAGPSDRLHLQKTMTADRSMWMAVRAYGDHEEPQFTTVAHSAPIYVVLDEQPTWKTETLVSLVEHQRAQLNELLTIPVDPNSDLESWETGDTLVDQWPKQLPLLRPRIEQADRRYQELLNRFRKSF